MTEEQQVGNLEGQGDVVANRQTSTPTSQPSVDVAALEKRLVELEKANKGLQKGIDKRIGPLESSIPQLMEFAKYLGADENKAGGALREYAIDQMIRREMGEVRQEQTTGTSVPQAVAVDVQGIVSKAGLEADAEVMAALKGLTDPVEIGMKLGEIKAKRGNQPTPTHAQAPATPGTPVPPPPGEKELVAELQQLQRTNPLSPRIDEIGKLLNW